MFRPAVGTIAVVGTGLLLLLTSVGQWWTNASYDTLFFFGKRDLATNKVVLVLMDNDACLQLQQARTDWSRELHAEFLRKLTKDQAALVVFDVNFGGRGERPMDLALADAMRQNKRVVVGGWLANAEHPFFLGTEPGLPHKLFLDAATGFGIAQCDDVRSPGRDWPTPTGN